MFTSEKYHYELVSKKSAKESRKNFQYTLDKNGTYFVVKNEVYLVLHISSTIIKLKCLKNYMNR
jgi:hypothetical protein